MGSAIEAGAVVGENNIGKFTDNFIDIFFESCYTVFSERS